jgi:hypothetical protein
VKALADVEALVPPFLKGTWKYLISTSDADSWHAMLSHFVQFEAKAAGNGVRSVY